MKGLKFTEQTGSVAICLFTVYVFYGFLYIPLVEYMSCLAIGGVTYGVTKSYEITLIAVLASSFLFQMMKVNKSEGFVSLDGAPLVMEGPVVKPEPSVKSESDVNSRSMRNSVQGFSSMMEGFADSNNPSGVIDVTSTPSSVIPSLTLPPPPPVSVPAPAAAAPAVPAKLSEQGVPPATQPAESFEDNGGLFKLGKLPTDEKGGFHIDAGTSVLNALKSLKPDQIQAMTQDTKQLIETQKSLMNMLQSFKPMMSEGKEMMATFQDMFSPTTTAPGSIAGALQAAKTAVATPMQ